MDQLYMVAKTLKNITMELASSKSHKILLLNNSCGFIYFSDLVGSEVELLVNINFIVITNWCTAPPAGLTAGTEMLPALTLVPGLGFPLQTESRYRAKYPPDRQQLAADIRRTIVCSQQT